MCRGYWETDKVKRKAKATNVFHGKGFRTELALILLCLRGSSHLWQKSTRLYCFHKMVLLSGGLFFFFLTSWWLSLSFSRDGNYILFTYTKAWLQFKARGKLELLRIVLKDGVKEMQKIDRLNIEGVLKERWGKRGFICNIYAYNIGCSMQEGINIFQMNSYCSCICEWRNADRWWSRLWREVRVWVWSWLAGAAQRLLEAVSRPPPQSPAGRGRPLRLHLVSALCNNE